VVPRTFEPWAIIEFLQASPRNFRRIDEDQVEDHVYLLGPGFDFPVVIPTYDLLNRSEVEEIMLNANIAPAEYRHLL
jgi:hypothetical protein